MASYVYRDRGGVRMGPEGVGSYGSAATLSAASFVEVRTDSTGVTYKPTREKLSTLTGRRNGQEVITTNKEYPWGYRSRVRAFTVPSTDTGARPSIHALLRACGFIETYDNNGGAGPYTLTYVLQDYPGAMDSVTLQDLRGEGAGTNALRRSLTGCRGSIKFSSTKGGLVMVEASGAGKGWTHADHGAAVPLDPTPSGQPLLLHGATHTLEETGGAQVYSGPLEGWEIDTAMNVQQIGDGTAAGLVDEIQLHPIDNMPGSVTIAEQLIATWNSLKLLEDDSLSLHNRIQIPDLANPNNSVSWEYYASMLGVGDVQLAGMVRGHKVDMCSTWFDASTPGVTPAESLRVVFQTTT